MSESHGPEIVFTFKSAHEAIAAEQALQKAGVQARVMSLPPLIDAACGLCLRVWPQERQTAAAALSAAGIAPQGVWQRQAGDRGARYAPCP